jgi:hypothetical protein
LTRFAQSRARFLITALGENFDPQE